MPIKFTGGPKDGQIWDVSPLRPINPIDPWDDATIEKSFESGEKPEEEIIIHTVHTGEQGDSLKSHYRFSQQIGDVYEYIFVK